METLFRNFFKGDQKKKTIVNSLKQNVLFRDLSTSQLNSLADVVHFRNYRNQEVVFSQGDPGVGMYLIVNGRIDIYIEDGGIEADQRKNICLLNEGDFFGEMALVENAGLRTATAISHGDSDLLGFFKPDLVEIINRSPEMGVKILWSLGQILSRRLNETTTKMKRMRPPEAGGAE